MWDTCQHVITSFTEDRDITDEELLTMGQRLYDADRYRFHPWDIVMNLQNQTNKSISEDVASRKWVDFDNSGRVATLVSIYLGEESIIDIYEFPNETIIVIWKWKMLSRHFILLCGSVEQKRYHCRLWHQCFTLAGHYIITIYVRIHAHTCA